MSGRVIARPDREHACRPGWTYSKATGDSIVPAGYKLAHPPSAYDYPAGTVWQCDDCGQVWVSTGAVAVNAPGVCGWRRESWWERRRRSK